MAEDDKKLIYLKNDNEIEKLRNSARLVSQTLAEVARYIRHGIATGELNQIAEDYITKINATPVFKGYGLQNNPFPGALCISVNDEVVHGVPGKRILNSGDIVSIDCGILKDGFIGDSAYTFIVEECEEEKMNLLVRTLESLYLGIDKARHGNTTGDIGYAIQSHCESANYGVIRQLVGHGLGRTLHEEPSIPNYGKPGRGKRLRKGMTLAIEPMITLGDHRVNTMDDGWTIVTADGLCSAHYEHDIVITDGEPEILSTFSYIEEITKIQIDHTIFANG